MLFIERYENNIKAKGNFSSFEKHLKKDMEEFKTLLLDWLNPEKSSNFALKIYRLPLL